MVPEIKVEFLLMGMDVSPDEITHELGIMPTSTWLAGELIPKTKMKYKQNGWSLAIGDLLRTYDLGDLLLPLFDILLPKSKLVTDICDRYQLDSEVSIVIYINDETPSINLGQKIISGLNELKTTIDIDIILLA